MKTQEKNKRLVLVGPVYPYKGGISHYTGLLYRALSKKYEVRLVSYKLQYPKLLFRKEQKDPSNDTFKAEGAEFLINTANPFNILKVAKDIIEKAPDCVIIQWWHPYFSPCYYILESRLKKAGIRILITCHNVFPHERFILDRFLTKLALKPADAYVLHSKKEAEELLTIKSGAEYRINPHPTYEAFNFSGLSKKEARELLKIEKTEKIALFFGFVREYKGLRTLIGAIGRLKAGSSPALEDFTLYVVGDFGGEENKASYMKLIEEKEISSLVSIVDGYVPDKEIERYFSASDVVIVPYESAPQSGIVQIAYGFRKPVIATTVGGLPDVVEDKVTGILIPPLDEESLARSIELYFSEIDYDPDSCLETALEKTWSENIREREYRFSWDRMTETIGELI